MRVNSPSEKEKNKHVSIFITCTSSHPEVSCKTGVLKNFAKFTEKRLYWSNIFNKVSGFQPVALLKMMFHKGVFK